MSVIMNLEDKVSLDELAPSLQNLLKSKTGKTDFDDAAGKVSTIYRNLGTVRVSIVASENSVPNPQQDKELMINTSDHTVEGYGGGKWYKCGGVYS